MALHTPPTPLAIAASLHTEGSSYASFEFVQSPLEQSVGGVWSTSPAQFSYSNGKLYHCPEARLIPLPMAVDTASNEAACNFLS